MQTVSRWLAIFNTDDEGRRHVLIEAWSDGRAMIVDPIRAVLVFADQRPGFSHLEQSPL